MELPCLGRPQNIQQSNTSADRPLAVRTLRLRSRLVGDSAPPGCLDSGLALDDLVRCLVGGSLSPIDSPGLVGDAVSDGCPDRLARCLGGDSLEPSLVGDTANDSFAPSLVGDAVSDNLVPSLVGDSDSSCLAAAAAAPTALLPSDSLALSAARLSVPLPSATMPKPPPSAFRGSPLWKALEATSQGGVASAVCFAKLASEAEPVLQGSARAECARVGGGNGSVKAFSCKSERPAAACLSAKALCVPPNFPLRTFCDPPSGAGFLRHRLRYRHQAAIASSSTMSDTPTIKNSLPRSSTP